MVCLAHADYGGPPASELAVAQAVELVAEHAPVVAACLVLKVHQERMRPTWRTSGEEKAFFSYDASCFLVEFN